MLPLRVIFHNFGSPDCTLFSPKARESCFADRPLMAMNCVEKICNYFTVYFTRTHLLCSM